MSRIKELESTLDKADIAYYDLSDPIMEDHEYDLLVKEYFELTKIKWMRQGNSGSIAHSRPMLSLNKAHTPEEVESQLGSHFKVVSPKIDGGGLSLMYDASGNFTQALTRGKVVSGISYGEDVTNTVKLIPGLKLRINSPGHPVEVRGEYYMPLDLLEVANAKRIEEGSKKFKNTRNAAAGILRNDDGSYVDFIRFIAYNAFNSTVPHYNDQWFGRYVDMIGWLRTEGFNTAPLDPIDDSSLTTLEDLYKKYVNRCPYAIDGIVLTIDDMAVQRSMGSNNRYPEYSIAYKFEDQVATSILRGIEWSATRTGRIVPVGVFDPVELDNTTVERATMHNYKNVFDKGFRIGHEVKVIRANQVIPQIEPLEPGIPQVTYIPKQCPSCDYELRMNDTRVDLICLNPQCGPKLVGSIVNAASKKNWDIDGLGESVAQILVDNKLVKDLSDLFKLPEAGELAILTHEGRKFGLSRARKLLDGIATAKLKPWHITLHALGCPGLGEPECKAIAQTYSLHDLLDSIGPDPIESDKEYYIDKLSDIKGIGTTTAKSFVNFIIYNYYWLEDLTVLGVDTNKEIIVQSSGNLNGLSFCITGTHSRPRSIIEKLITDNGGTITSSVSKKLNYLVAGDNAGSKLDKASKLGLNILNEQQLMELINDTNS